VQHDLCHGLQAAQAAIAVILKARRLTDTVFMVFPLACVFYAATELTAGRIALAINVGLNGTSLGGDHRELALSRTKGAKFRDSSG
jgi:hypothetical protein